MGNEPSKFMVLQAKIKEAAAEGEASEGGLTKLSRRFVASALAANGMVLKDVKQEYRYTKELVLIAVEENGLALEFASPDLQADRDVVVAAVTNNGASLGFADPKFKTDYDIALLAVKSNGMALQFTPRFKMDKDLVVHAVLNDMNAVKYAAKCFQTDAEVQAIIAEAKHHLHRSEQANQAMLKHAYAEHEKEEHRRRSSALSYASMGFTPKPRNPWQEKQNLLKRESGGKSGKRETLVAFN